MKVLRVHPIEKEKALGRCELFRGLSPEDRYQLAGISACTEYARGEILFTRGERAESLFVVSKGKLKIYCVAPDGREQIVHIINPGEICAEVPMFSGGRYPANAIAIGKTEVITFSRHDFLIEAKKKPEVLLSMLASISARLRHFVDLVNDLSLRDVATRLARFLLASGEDGQVTLTESKRTLAGQLGTAPETLSRTLQQFQQQGLITVSGKNIRLENKERLLQMLED